MKKAVGVLAAAAVAASIGGCSTGGGAAGEPRATPVAVASTATPSTSTTPSPSTTTTAPRPTTASPPPAQNPALATALNNLAAHSRALKSNAALAGVRSSVAAGLSTSRKGLVATRAAAYQSSVRNCSSVARGLATTRSGAAVVAKAAAGLPAVGATRQRQLTALQGSITTVRALGAKAKPGAAPSATEIAAALQAAQAQLTEETAALAAIRKSTAEGLGRARATEASAAAIYSKAC
ncbi:MAG TPA: hypothetical protein VIB11_17425 [Pedococcus sp.]|uniref:hypothetical protein n=1 Tax=Pedococcus sp. TaxID=2860345 RepID=UPI002F91D291